MRVPSGGGDGSCINGYSSNSNDNSKTPDLVRAESDVLTIVLSKYLCLSIKKQSKLVKDW